MHSLLTKARVHSNMQPFNIRRADNTLGLIP